MSERQSRRILLGIAAGILVVGLFVLSRFVCIPAFVKSGVLIERCPDGDFRQTLELDCSSLRRETEGNVRVGAWAHYTTGPADQARRARVRRVNAEVSLVDAAGKETKLPALEGWSEDDSHAQVARVKLPRVPDGDYLLRAKVGTSLGQGTIELPLAIYAPAKVHLLTDRPLYEPGNLVRFRAVVLRARDLIPLDGRPGRFEVVDPTGETLLEEKAPAGAFGVVAGSFPLDGGAATGDWRVRWISGEARDEAVFRVEPFTLPRFRVEAAAPRPFYRPGDRPILKGRVVYSSGAPVAGAALTVAWNVGGAWPPPTSWLESALPRLGKTDPAGQFSLELPVVPADLQGQATLLSRISAVDPAGDRVEGSAAVLLSEDAIAVSGVTELDGGLVEGFNNRVYLRATTAAGTVLPKAELLVKRAWEPSDRGIQAVTDEDGVASFQLDPGPAVNVVIPARPYRPPPRPAAISRGGARELIFGEELSLGDQLALDRQLPGLGPCARFVDGGGSGAVGLRVEASGAVTATVPGEGPFSACLARAFTGVRLPAGKDRLFWIDYSANSTHLPSLEVNVEGVPEAEERVTEALRTAALDARSCLPLDTEDAPFPRLLTFRHRPPGRELSVSWVRDPEGRPLPESAVACVQARFERLTLEAPEEDGGERPQEQLGVAHLSVEPAALVRATRPQAMTMLGYELRVSARLEGTDLGATTLRMSPGAVPPVRLRATPVLAAAGQEVTVEILRGPNFSGELPEKLWLRHELSGSIEAKVEQGKRLARFKLPADAEGFFQVGWGGSRALVYVRPRAELSVELEPSSPRYAPGQLARLNLRTSVGGQGHPAAVGLFGVDASLAQLTTLRGGDDMARLRPRVEVSAPAFGSLDGQALVMGRIRGEHAAAATILRVTTIPTPGELDSYVYGRSSTSFDPLEELTDRFYTVLGELHVQVRRWEEQAPVEEKMLPPTMARLFGEAVAACEGRKEPVKDAFGRRLGLSMLPPDLLALTDPRAVVVAGTRLPEDVESFSKWVAKEQP